MSFTDMAYELLKNLKGFSKLSLDEQGEICIAVGKILEKYF